MHPDAEIEKMGKQLNIHVKNWGWKMEITLQTPNHEELNKVGLGFLKINYMITQQTYIVIYLAN